MQTQEVALWAEGFPEELVYEIYSDDEPVAVSVLSIPTQPVHLEGER